MSHATAPPITPIGGRDRLRRAMRGEEVDRPPVWIMRQAGRYLPEYRELRRSCTFMEAVRSPDKAVAITLQPLRRFDLDAAIVFSDILIVPEALGLEVGFPEGGPRITPTLADADPDALPEVDASQAFPWLAESLRRLRAQLGDGRALLGFAGAPFTLACYCVEGKPSSDFPAVRRLLNADPGRFQALLQRLAQVVADLLVLQVKQGVDAVQVFDTWAGLLSRADHEAHVAPHVHAVIERVHAAGGRVILFHRDAGHLLEPALQSGADTVALDWRCDVAAAAKLAEGRCSLQGNLDPAVLHCSPDVIRSHVRRIHAEVDGRTGHVFNLGHGIGPTTPIEGVAAFLDAVHELGGGS